MFFTCILPDYVSHESIKEFWKNSRFENMRPDFLRRCQNSFRQTSSEMMHFYRHEKNILTDIMLLLLIQAEFRHTEHLKMTVWISVLWKTLCSWPFMSHKFPFFSYKIAKNWKQNKNVFYVIAFDLIKILRSWASQNDRQILSFMQAFNIVGKKWPETVVKWSPSVVWFVSNRSLPSGKIK